MLYLIPTLLAEANTSVDITPGGQFGKLNFSVSNLLSAGVTLALVVAGIVCFFMLVIGGIRWIISGGDKAGTEAARNQITAALVGLVIVFAAWAIANLLGTFFGVGVFKFTLPSVTNPTPNP